MFKIICSNILHDVLVNDIGLTLEGSPLFPALGIGVILAFLQSSGSSDTARDLRKTKPRYLLHHCTYRLRKGLGKLSGPEDFFGSSSSKRLNIPSSLTSIGLIPVISEGGGKVKEVKASEFFRYLL